MIFLCRYPMKIVYSEENHWERRRKIWFDKIVDIFDIIAIKNYRSDKIKFDWDF